jgi:hypothetical protein
MANRVRQSLLSKLEGALARDGMLKKTSKPFDLNPTVQLSQKLFLLLKETCAIMVPLCIFVW